MLMSGESKVLYADFWLYEGVGAPTPCTLQGPTLLSSAAVASKHP